MPTNINILKSWFETGDKPTQEQFGNLIDSYRHLDNKIILNDLSNDLQAYLNNLAQKSVIVLEPGQSTYEPDNGTLVEFIVIDDESNPLVDIGFDENGSDIAEALQLEDGEYVLQKSLRIKDEDRIIYFSGITNDTVITIYKR